MTKAEASIKSNSAKARSSLSPLSGTFLTAGVRLLQAKACNLYQRPHSQSNHLYNAIYTLRDAYSNQPKGITT